MPKKQLPKTILYSYLALVIANLIWAAAGPVIKITLESLPPFTFLFFRFLLVCLLILPYTILEIKKTKIYVKDWGKLALLGVFSQSCIAFVFWGLKYTTAIDAAIIGSIGVLLSMAAGHYFFYEKINTGIKIGIIFALLGTFIVILEPLLTTQVQIQKVPTLLRVWGNILVFISHVTFLIYIIWSKISFGQMTNKIKSAIDFIHIKPMKGKYSEGFLTAISFYVGLLSMIPFAIFENLNAFGPVNYDITDFNHKALFGLLYMAVFSSIVAYFLFEIGLKKVGLTETAVLGYLSSLFGIPFAYLMLGEIPTMYSLAGGAVIAVGVAVAEISAHVHRKEHSRKFFGLLKK